MPKHEEPIDPYDDNVQVRKLYAEAERILEKATTPEELKKNPYHGKPLNLEANPYDRGYGMAFRMLKSSGFKLPWMEMKDEIGVEREKIRRAVRGHAEWLEQRLDGARARGMTADVQKAMRVEHERFMAYAGERVEQLRAKIARFNLEVPMMDQQMMNVRLEHFMAPVKERVDAVLAAIAGESSH